MYAVDKGFTDQTVVIEPRGEVSDLSLLSIGDGVFWNPDANSHDSAGDFDTLEFYTEPNARKTSGDENAGHLYSTESTTDEGNDSFGTVIDATVRDNARICHLCTRM